MSKPIRVLIVEDSEDDAFLIIEEIRRGGYEPAFERVETRKAMEAALDNGSILVESEVGKGTTFKLKLPIK